MRRRTISKSLQAALLGALVISAIAWLKPDAIEIPEEALRNTSSMRRSTDMHPSMVVEPDSRVTPWLRRSVPLQIVEVPSAPSPPVKTVIVQQPPQPITPPPPIVPDPPFKYLGQLVDGNHAQIFLGQNNQSPLVTTVGATIDGQWKIEQVTAAGIGLRYLPLNEVRQISIP